MIVNDNMADVEASSRSVLFGNFGYYGVRNVGEIAVELFDDSATNKTYSVHMVGFSSADGRAMAASSSDAFKVLVQGT